MYMCVDIYVYIQTIPKVFTLSDIQDPIFSSKRQKTLHTSVSHWTWSLFYLIKKKQKRKDDGSHFFPL